MKSYKTSKIIRDRLTKIFTVFVPLIAFGFHISAQRKVFLINNHNNPLKNFSIPSHQESHPFFIDVDGDGDLDCFSGEYTNGELSKIYYYRNDGTDKYPVFKQITGTANPLNKVVANTLSIPYFIDIDDDDDYDCFIGDGYTGAVIYYKNIGTAKEPVFVHIANSEDPFHSLESRKGIYNVSFEDWNRDGLTDLFV